MPYTYGSSIWGDLLMAYNGTAIQYDGSGNPVAHGSNRFTWEHGRQLATMTRDGSTRWNYTYNNAGLRTGRYVENGTSYKYVYNGSQLVQMTKDNQTVTFAYDAAGTPLTMKVGTNTYYYVTNIQGDVVALVTVSEEGTEIAASYSYTAYGVVTVTGDSDVITLNPLTYRGYVYDAETGLYYLQSRYYDPAVGRFINADGFVSTGQGLLGNNMFAYCGNNPVMGYDPCGTCEHNGKWFKSCNKCKEEDVARLISEYADQIIAAGEEYGVDPTAIAACIYLEQLYNVNWKDHIIDPLLYVFDTSIGIGQVRVSTARMLEDAGYIEKTTAEVYYDIESSYVYCSRDSIIAAKLGNPETNIRYVAAYLKYWQDTWASTYDISDRIDVLCTLYNLGVNANQPNKNPQAGTFGVYYLKHSVRIYKVLYGVE